MRKCSVDTCIGWIALALIMCGGCAWRAPAGDLDRRVADRYGAADFHRVESLRYTFNVKKGDQTVNRSWIWEPGKDRVTFWTPGDAEDRISYIRGELTAGVSDRMKSVDARFINDQYWLLFPLHLAWDRDAVVTESPEPVTLPIGSGRARRLVIQYPPAGGYTPGDVYELFVAEDLRLVQWIYRKGGAPTPTRITTWDKHRRLGPLLVSLERQDADGSFRVWFTDVKLRLAGSGAWLTPD